ncbi:hypothetical protein BDK51DRAFT_39875 [Blyttiomyces helicus]|uniref:Uncharacterized protein n=1 Tax=Blyttiomyces helicus TaxID=388810 RepID=A0A4P9VUZ9_9FUNG|nr:hypothetical protein BDK51DRAFT_39875 [Blyttiomyces helicus]|eukprot:RKO83441.1 hypothetical protein BDK51DRAFT_39875 [Blyttiomyces helicus]
MEVVCESVAGLLGLAVVDVLRPKAGSGDLSHGQGRSQFRDLITLLHRLQERITAIEVKHLEALNSKFDILGLNNMDALRKERDALRNDQDALRKGLDALRIDHDALQKGHDRRHAQI